MIQRIITRLCLTTILLAPFSAQSAELETFSSEDIRARYFVLIDDLRCPQCQNQNLSDSDSAIAIDLRRAVLRMLEEGKTDQEIVDFLIDRYGDFIIYMPQFKPGTYSLWLLPVVLAVLGLVVVVLVVRRQRKPAVDAPLTAEQQKQLDNLLNQEPRS